MKQHSRALVRTIEEHLLGGEGRDKPLKGAEIGVWAGANSATLLREFPCLHLFMVDNWTPTPNSSDKRMAAKTQDDHEDSLLEALECTKHAARRRFVIVGHSVDVAMIFPDESLDFIFLDAAHDYESVKIDVLCWAKKVRSGGIVSGHDYGGKGDREGIFGVKRAVDELFGEVNLRSGNVWWIKLD